MAPPVARAWSEGLRPGDTRHWPRWRTSDALSKKEPDVFIGESRDADSVTARQRYSKTRWSLRETEAETETETEKEQEQEQERRTNRDCCCRNGCVGRDGHVNGKEKGNTFWVSRRETDERYDFRTRRYEVPDRVTSRAVEYCDVRVQVSRGYPDRHVGEYRAGYWHEVVHEAYGDRYAQGYWEGNRRSEDFGRYGERSRRY